MALLRRCETDTKDMNVDMDVNVTVNVTVNVNVDMHAHLQTSLIAPANGHRLIPSQLLASWQRQHNFLMLNAKRSARNEDEMGRKGRTGRALKPIRRALTDCHCKEG